MPKNKNPGVKSMDKTRSFHIHGDNIVECERASEMIRSALVDITTTFVGPIQSSVCPGYKLTLNSGDPSILLTLFPGFSRWNEDILGLIRSKGGILREVADVIITEVINGEEIPVMAIEYCGALPAGNQAWQRSGRAFSFGVASVPYIYVAELGGYELGSNRERKAARLPNPAVPFSYVAYSLYNEKATLPAFVPNPGADRSSHEEFADTFGEVDLLLLIRGVILGKRNDKLYEALSLKALTFVEKRASRARPGRTLTPEQWANAYKALQSKTSLVEFLVKNARLTWSKVAYIDALTSTAKSLMQQSARLAIGLTSSELPICIVPAAKRLDFADVVKELYKNKLPLPFLNWLRSPKNLTICWVMGFKPRGDDARPDRGLPPLTRMLIGSGEDLLTVVYGPAPETTWSNLDANPSELLRNGLWEAIFVASDAILADSATDNVGRHAYLRDHWHHDHEKLEGVSVLVKPWPTNIGEHDVDTVLHLLLARYAGEQVFEGMCNPPGGDWSGVSLQVPDRSAELRWLTLPRVSGKRAKRPDHVFQFFIEDKAPIILAIESKEKITAVEKDIGTRLKNYLRDLVRTPASIERSTSKTQWSRSERTLDLKRFDLATAIACLSGPEKAIADVKARANADLLFLFSFDGQRQTCTVKMVPMTKLGQHLSNLISAVPLSDKGLTIEM